MSNPSPGKPSRWSRMGTVVRRTSSVLTISRPATPSVNSDRDSDSTSIRQVTPARVDTTTAALAPPPPSQGVFAPSPIAESPAREAAASDDNIPIGPSPLSRQEPVSESVLVANPEPLARVEEATSPAGYTPPPVLDSTVGNPGAFTDEPEELPQPTVIEDPYSSKPASVFNLPRHESEPQPLAESSSELSKAVEEPATDASGHDSEPHATEESHEPVQERTLTESIAEEPPAPEPPVLDAHPSYFDKPVVESVHEYDPSEQISPGFAKAIEENSPVAETTPELQAFGDGHSQDAREAPSTHVDREVEAPYIPSEPVPQASHPIPIPSKQPEPKPYVIGDVFYTQGKNTTAEQANTDAGASYRVMPMPVHEQSLPPVSIYSLPAYEIHEGHQVWGGKAPTEATRDAPSMPIPSGTAGNGDASVRSQASSVRLPAEDPFADPAPTITVSHPDMMPLPNPHVSETHQQLPVENHEEVHGAIIMPMEPIHEVTPARSLHHASSTQSFGPTTHDHHHNHHNHNHHVETDERRPLLSPPGTPKQFPSYLQPSTHHATFVNVSPSSPFPASAAKLHNLGWLEYHLPDGTCYYVHPTRSVTTDINLRSDKALHTVTAYLEDRDRTQLHGHHGGVEVWLRDIGTAKKGFMLSRSLVDHHARTVIAEKLEVARKGKGKGKAKVKKAEEEDHLDMEYRYWSFMEAHPAHTALSTKAKAEAFDVLTWAWTDRLLPSHRSIPAPFTQEECQELMSLLRTFGTVENQGDLGIQTRVTSRILLRVVQWRQAHFRPSKPLPKDVVANTSGLPTQHRPFRRAVFDILISCLCLGIPYIFFERTQYHRMDEEGGLRSAGPLFMIGACTCLVVRLIFSHYQPPNPEFALVRKAAVVLSASVTFLSLPGLDNIARIAGLVAILFASFSMATTLVAIFRYKADMGRAASHVGVEGLVMLSRRSIVMALPLVFLAYSIIGFITGIVLYTFRGTISTDPNHDPFDDYTRWTVVGVLGALAGMLTVSLFFLRR
ncbi:hypothetical protein BDQ12DRAFT_727898 [Crucibulum laeve]|uniref:Uncharacterized protein n=1 Tax=Crucibulum laeve TaxID=68775 RepID=A0A5C3LKT9_9AGAR|nr:hypothetical protein BDQ12DRAFT_727898 [Crucibulum laeve]